MQRPDGASQDGDSGRRQLPPLMPPPVDPRFGNPAAGSASVGGVGPGTGVGADANQGPQQAGQAMQPGQHQPGQHSVQPAPSQQSAAPQQPAAVQAPTAPQTVAQQAPFPLARVFDGVKPDGGPLISRPKLDPREAPALIAYLTRAPVALLAPGTMRDELVASAPPNVPRAFHTDGVWVWPAAVGYYLSLYQLPPQPELLAHVRSRRYTIVPVHPQAVQAIGAQLMSMLNAQQTQQQQPQPTQQPQQAQAPQQTAKPAPEPLPQRHPKPKPQPQVQQQSQAQPELQPQAQPQPAIGEPAEQDSGPIVRDPVPTGQHQLAPAPGPVAQEPARTAPRQPVVQRDVASLSAFSAPFNAAGNRHAAWVTEQLEAFLDYLPLGDWSVDHSTRSYQQSGRDFRVDALGALSPGGVWTWSWADPEMWGGNPAMVEQALRLRGLGEQYAMPELTTPQFGLAAIADAPESPQDAAEMIAWTAMGLLGARGYIGHSATADDQGGRIYYVVCDPHVPEASPRLENVPRVLTEGADTFGEGAVDCVIGYVDHHGWEWSRVPEGIAVAAPGLGAFTALVSRIGELTGVRLGVGAPHDGAATRPPTAEG